MSAYGRALKFLSELKPGDSIPPPNTRKTKGILSHPSNLKYSHKVNQLYVFKNKHGAVETFNFAQIMDRMS